MTAPASLPERLRLRVVALGSAELPSVVPLPPALRKIAGFAPTRRARLGESAIWAALRSHCQPGGWGSPSPASGSVLPGSARPASR